MKVAVKKSVLFNLLKKRLNENRSQGDMAGRVIHPFNQSPDLDPFGYYEDDSLPVKSNNHMASQLSIEEPPVDDEEYVPATIDELRAAASVISKEVPINQIEFFYRKLHMSLDEALDREDEDLNGGYIHEAVFNISKKTTIREFNVLSEAVVAQEAPGYQETSDKGEFTRGFDFAADFNPEGKSEDELEQHESYLESQSDAFKAGYNSGIEVSLGDQPFNKQDERPWFMKEPGLGEQPGTEGVGRARYRNYQQYLTRQSIKDITGKDFESLTPFERAVYNLHDEIQLLFKKVDAEYTKELMDADFVKEFGNLLKPLTHQYKIDQNTVLNPIKVKQIFSRVSNIKNPAMREQKINEFLMLIYKRLHGIVTEMMASERYINRMITKLAEEAGEDVNKFINKLVETISADYANYGLSSRFDTADALIENILSKEFSMLIRTVKMSPDSDKKFKNMTHFTLNVDLDAEEDFKEMFFEFVESQHKVTDEEFEFKDKDMRVLITPEEARSYTNGYVAGVFAGAKNVQEDKRPSDDDSQDTEDAEDVELTEEEKYIKKIEKYAELIARGQPIDWQDLFPYFGFSNVSGIRQWFLKKVDPKIRLFKYKYVDEETGEVRRASINDLFDQNMELIIKKLEEAIREKVIPAMEEDLKKGKLKQRNYDQKKHKVKQVDETLMLDRLKNEALPDLQQLIELMETGMDFTDLASEQLTSTLGGWLARTVGSYPLDALVTKFSSEWANEIKSIINQIRAKHNPDAGPDLSKEQLDSVVEYFTGLKGDPDFEDKNKAAKNLIKAGINPIAYLEIMANANNIWIDLESKMDEMQDGAELAALMIDEVDNFTEDVDNMAKAVHKAYKESVQEMEDRKRARQVGL